MVIIRFGRFVANDNIAAGLNDLLQNDAWHAKGQSGWEYTPGHFEIRAVIYLQLEAYTPALANREPF